jgi:hypothetical protein
MAQTGREIEQALGIVRDAFCATCGYNLRTRSVVGRCPECGGEYDARPLGRRGILAPQDLRIPYGDYLRFVGCSAGGLLLLHEAIVGGSRWAYFPAIPVLVMGLLFLRHGVKRTVRFVRHRALLRQTEEGEGD